jgi:hypothetical protein
MKSITNTSAVSALVTVLMLLGGSAFMPVAVHAQDVGDNGCCDTGSSYDYSYPTDTGSSYDYSYPTNSGNSYDYSYPTDNGSSFDYSYPTDTGSSYDYSYPTDTGSSYDYFYPTYSSTPSYSSGSGYSAGSGSGYSVANPSYASRVYSTPGTGYSSGGGIFTTAGTGYSISPIYTPAPIVRSTPVVTPIVQQQQQQTTTVQPVTVQPTTAQPIIINNTNTNTNTNPNTNTVTNYAPVTVATPQPVVAYVYPATCSITVANNGNGTILSWTSNYASTAVLSNIGSVPTNGSYTVYPTNVMNYTLTVYSTQGTSGTCNVTVGPRISNRSVSWTQIPYTGFDFGPFGDAIYWAALMSFAVAAAYLLVYYRGGAFTLATAMMGRSSIKPMNFTETDEETVETTHEPIVEAPAPIQAHIPASIVNARVASVIHNLPAAEVRRVTSDAMIVNHSTNGNAPRIVITRE